MFYSVIVWSNQLIISRYNSLYTSQELQSRVGSDSGGILLHEILQDTWSDKRHHIGRHSPARDIWSDKKHYSSDERLETVSRQEVTSRPVLRYRRRTDFRHEQSQNGQGQGTLLTSRTIRKTFPVQGKFKCLNAGRKQSLRFQTCQYELKQRKRGSQKRIKWIKRLLQINHAVRLHINDANLVTSKVIH